MHIVLGEHHDIFHNHVRQLFERNNKVIINLNMNDYLSSYGVGFMYTTALPPDKINAALLSLQLLKSEEGQKLREKHQGSVKRLRVKLAQHGFPVERTPSHIVPILVRM